MVLSKIDKALLIEENESINKIKVRKIREKKNQQLASASVIGQRPNSTIANYSALSDCENSSFGHCLLYINLHSSSELLSFAL